jgi:DNA-binding MarR family transcriptional regulator/GNAT superfamily N-acetyltransferase
MTDTELSARVEAVRRFSRFYTRKIGVLREGLLGSPFSLTEARVIWELAHRQQATASALGTELGLDAGYLSRILRGFEERGLIARQTSDIDARQTIITLSRAGEAAFARLNTQSQNEIAALIGALPASAQRRLVEALGTVEALLGEAPAAKVPYILRPHQPGDIGWVVHRHGALYAEEYGWDERFEALVAGIVAEFVTKFDARRERCWIAERDGQSVGSVFLVRHSETVAKLRLLLVEPSARGLGIGQRLVEECARFARRTGYDKISLWTNNNLLAARAIYAKAGYRLVKSEPHALWGAPLIGETWELDL